MMNGQIHDNTHLWGYRLTLLTLFGTFILPSFSVFDSFPKIEVSDITFPILLLLTIITARGQLYEFYRSHKAIILSFIGFIIVGIVSIVINGRYGNYRDWFEPIKFIKLLCFLFFFYHFIEIEKWRQIIKLVFILVIVFNIFHYFNLFSFNELIMPYYAAPHHLDFFGLNSIGLPATKRMIGVVGNPNNNAIVFLLFTLFFLPKRKSFDWKEIIYALIAIIGVLACQSRTGFITLLILIILWFLIARPNWKVILVFSLVTLMGFSMFEMGGNNYIGSLGDSQQLEHARLGRFDQWNKIITSMPGYWLLGHGVNKAYFEKHDIYAESEYFLVLFRYGVLGIFSLIGFWLIVFIKSLKAIKKSREFLLFGTVTIFMFSGITNSPMHSTKLSIIMMLALGMGLALMNGKEKV